MTSITVYLSASMFHGLTGQRLSHNELGIAMQQVTTRGAPLLPTPPPGETISQQHQTRPGLSACKVSLVLSLPDLAVFQFSSYSPCMDPQKTQFPAIPPVLRDITADTNVTCTPAAHKCGHGQVTW
jgi:hypothetical protein